MNRLLLVDGTAYLVRAYYALPAFTTANGRPTGALHGVVSMIQRLLREQPPDLLAFVMDAPGPTFRDEIYPEYKANRDVMPEDLREQIEPVVNVVEAMGVPLLRIGGVEADDVIGTLAAQAREEGLDTLISTTDKDFAQLVGPHVRLVNWTNNRVMDSAAVEEKFGVPPERIRDYLALAGDTSDNIPGVRYTKAQGTFLAWLDMGGLMDRIDAQGKADHENRTAADPVSPESILQRWLAENARIYLNNGPSYGTGGERHMRMNIATSRTLVKRALDNLSTAVAEL